MDSPAPVRLRCEDISLDGIPQNGANREQVGGYVALMKWSGEKLVKSYLTPLPVNVRGFPQKAVILVPHLEFRSS